MKRISLSIVIAGLLFSGTAQAYILPPEFIMRMLADKQRSLKTGDWSLKLSTELIQQNQVINERLYLKRPERIRRVQINGDQVSSIYVEKEGKTAVGNERSLQASQENITNLIASIMVPKGKTLTELSARMLKNLQKVGIDTSQIALGRLKDRPVFIVGAKAWEQDKPQIWFDKSTFLPVHWLIYTQMPHSGDKIEMTLSDYGSSAAGSIYPQLIETYRNGALLSRSNLMEVKKDQPHPESFFKLQ